ncbi:hypothetical protein [Spiroplasma gladiatoris]|uniref:hypothetical protein n=1 Tax=Spiroplasma gladiatoris TaxID=2143 RepID=UPI003C7BF3C5
MSVIKDANIGFIVGHEVSLKNDINIYKKSLEKASLHRKDISKKLIIYSDNGIQYTSVFARRYAKKNNVIISLSRPGNSVDKCNVWNFFLFIKRRMKN